MGALTNTSSYFGFGVGSTGFAIVSTFFSTGSATLAKAAGAGYETTLTGDDISFSALASACACVRPSAFA